MRQPAWRQVRRRVEVISLRWHARLDSDWADRSLPWILAGGLFVLLTGLALARNRMLVHGVDLADYTQAAWNLGQGEPAEMTVRDAQLLEMHGSLAFYGMAWVTRLLPIQTTLLVAQALALAYGVLPLWRLARRVVLLRVGATIALVVAYGLHPVLQNLNLSDFHPEALAVPALLAMSQRGLSGSTVRYAAAAAAAVAVRADIALLVAAFGVMLVARGRRRAGVVTVAAASAWVVASFHVAALGAGNGYAVVTGAYAELGAGFWDVVGELVTNPLATLGRIVRRENFDLALELLLPVAFLPLLSARWLLVLSPWALLVALADVPDEVRTTVLAAPMLPFVVVGATFGLGHLGRPTLERVSVSPRVIGALLLASLTFTVAWSRASPYEHPWGWGGRDAADRARLDAVERIDDDAVVQATDGLLALVARRPRIEVLASSEDLLEDEVDAVLLDVAAVPRDDPLLEGPPPGFTTAYSAEGVLLYLRPGAGQVQER
ncbi:MAG: DUF2079 domain-containing protein [Acidimicrobiia bacterium]|nr:DUF2079 domain-containing protein [Acidimicrobiia bacterium]